MTDQNETLSPEELIRKGQAQAESMSPEALKEIAKEQEELEKEVKTLLRESGKMFGLTFGPNEGIPSMRQKLMDAKAIIVEQPETAEEAAAPDDVKARRRALKLDAMRLVRLQISCLNPGKAELPGEIFTVHAEAVGTAKKFVPYNEAGESYHVPNLIYKYLRGKKYLQIKDPPKGSRLAPTQKLVPEFALVVLPPLTPAELRELARAQGAAEAAENE
jgi:hypothetical protein